MAVFIWTAKVNRKKMLLAAAGVVLACGLVCAVAVLGGRGAEASATVSGKGIKTNEDRVAYLEGYGWQVSPEAAAVEELALPDEFGTEYSEYLALQAEQGFDLTKYAGKRVKRYTYVVNNYPTGEANVQAHLILSRNRVIGGEILGDGFIQGLEMPG